MTKKKQLTYLNYAAILSIFVFAGAGSFMNAAVQTMMDAWPQLSPTMVRMVTSLPSLVSLPVTIWIGTVAGKKLSFRFCSIAGTALIMAAGAAPFFFHSNWWLVLAFRGLVGVGVGLVAMRNSLILCSVPVEHQARIVGYGSSLFNLGGMLAGPIVGILAGMKWNYSFLYDLLAAVPLFLMFFFLKEPNQMEDRTATEPKTTDSAIPESNTADSTFPEPKTADTAGAHSLNPRLIAYILLQFITTAALYPLLSGMASYMASNRFGSPFLAGLVVSAYNLAGVLINLVLSPLLQKMGRHALWITHAVFAAGMGLIVFLPAVPTLFVGSAICGMTFNTLISVYQLYNGRVASGSQATLVSTLLIAALSLGNFASVYYINFCHQIFHLSSDIKSTYLGSMILFLAAALLCLIFKIAPRENYE